VKSPKFFVRDSGLVHALLGLENLEALLSHPVAGPSWEAFVVEQLLALVEPEAQAFHYRTSGGAEVDLYITWPDGESWQIEIKRSLSPRPSRGFHSARQDLQPTRALIIHPGDQSFPLGNEIEALSLGAALADLKQRSHS
jgi:predicted AAA+ superfamily ATPase